MNVAIHFRTRTWAFAFIALVVATGLSACASAKSGTEIGKDKVSQIQKGVTTRAEVESLLGPPSTVAMMTDGRRMMVYSGMQIKAQHDYYKQAIPLVGTWLPNSSNTSRRRQSLQIMLSKANVVEDFEYADTTTETKSSVNVFNGKSQSTTTQN